MAEGTMASYTGKILVEHPTSSWGIQTFRVNGASELKPGYVCTATGHTAPDIAKPDGDSDVTLGVVLDLPDQDLDSYYDDNDEVSVALVGSGAVVWVYVDDDEGALVAGTPVYSTGADDDGYVEKMIALDAPASYDEATVQGLLDDLTNQHLRYLGRLYENIPDQGSTDTPAKVVLV